jgi:hypothetical protein
MTRFYKYIFYTIILSEILIPVFSYFDLQLSLLIFVTLNVITLLLGLSGIFDKITVKPLGKEVLGLSAILQGIVYILLSFSFTYLIIGIFFNIIEGGEEFINVSSGIFLLFIVLSLFSPLLPANQNIKFGITQPWIRQKHQEKINKITKYIDKYGYLAFSTNMEMYKFALVFKYFDRNIQVGIYNSFNDKTAKWFEDKVNEAENIKLSNDEINKTLDYLIEEMESSPHSQRDVGNAYEN